MDVETTGLFARGSDRVVEIGVVVVDEGGEVRDEYATLVNPLRDLGPTDIHGIRGRDVVEAPTFAEIVGDISARFRGRVLVAHNARFDRDFLTVEFARAGYQLPDVPWLCTMDMGGRATGMRGLSACCDALGVALERPHCARDDAFAAALVLAACLRLGEGRSVLDRARASVSSLDPDGWPPVVPCGRTVQRIDGRPSPRESYVAALLARLPAAAFSVDGADSAYLELLDRVLEDRRVTEAEAESLYELAEAWGIDRSACTSLHGSYLRALVAAARQDEIVTDAERADLEDVAALLAVESEVLEELLAAPFVHDGSTFASDSRAEPLAGMTVCFTGQLTCTIAGEVIGREEAETFARERGLVIKQSVSKKLDLLVLADPESLSGKTQKAREYGTRIMVERAFWVALGVGVD